MGEVVRFSWYIVKWGLFLVEAWRVGLVCGGGDVRVVSVALRVLVMVVVSGVVFSSSIVLL